MNLKTLNLQERLIDFMAYILADYPELLNEVNYFFCPRSYIKSEEILLKFNKVSETNIYKFYLEQTIDFEEILKSISINVEFDFSEKDVQFLKDYINKNYSWGYPDDYEDGLLTGGNINIDIDDKQFKKYLFEYKNLIKLNDKVFISYFKYNIIDSNDFIKEFLVAENKKIKKLLLDSYQISSQYKDKFDKYQKEKYIKKYISEFELAKFVFSIYKNEEDNFVNDVNESIILQLRKLNNYETFEFSNQIDSSEIKFSLNEFLLNLFKFHFEKTPLTENFEKLDNDFKDLLKNNEKYLQFLLKKGFEKKDVSNILNLLSNNAYSELGYKSITRNTSQVEVFHLLWCFYIFDFFEQENKTDFVKAKDFDLVINFQELLKVDNNQIKKYYDNIKNNGHNNYPFTTFNTTLKILLKDFIKDETLLNQVPKNNLNFC